MPGILVGSLYFLLNCNDCRRVASTRSVTVVSAATASKEACESVSCFDSMDIIDNGLSIFHRELTIDLILKGRPLGQDRESSSTGDI